MNFAKIVYPVAMIFIIGFTLVVIGGFWKEGDNALSYIGFITIAIAVTPVVFASIYYGARSFLGKKDQ